MDAWQILLTSGLAVALVTAIKELLMWWLNRKAAVDDREEQTAEERLEQRLTAIDERLNKIDVRLDEQKNTADSYRAGLMITMRDRIKHLGQRYLSNGEISYDDREIIIEMHDTFHNRLGGNGNLDALMDAVKALPLKK